MLKGKRLILNFILLLLVLQTAVQMRAQNGTSTNYAGWLDHAGCDTIVGWAADGNRLNTPISVQIYDSGFQIAAVTANAVRPDVGSVLGDNGLHGFTVPTPTTLKDGFQHNISVRFENSIIDLSGSPQLVTCKAPPPAMSATHLVSSAVPGKPLATVTNQFNRDSEGRTRYKTGDVVIINDPVARRTILLNTRILTYSVFPWSTPSGTVSTTPGPPVQQNLISTPFDPGDFDFTGFGFTDGTFVSLRNFFPSDTATCPALGKGYSVTIKPLPSPAPAPTPSVVRMWTCPSMSLPMYTTIDDQIQGRTVTAFYDLALGPQDPQLFIVPAGYTEDKQLKGTVQSAGPSCTTMQFPAPVLLFSDGSNAGQGTFAAFTNAANGCVVSSVSIQIGPSISALPLTLRGGSAFHILFSDNGGANPAVPGAEVAIVNLTVSNSTTSATTYGYVIMTKF